MPLTPEQRQRNGRLGAHVAHSRNDSKQMTANARAALRSRFEREVDPDGVLAPEERARRADHAHKAHMARMGIASGKAKRARREAGGE